MRRAGFGVVINIHRTQRNTQGCHMVHLSRLLTQLAFPASLLATLSAIAGPRLDSSFVANPAPKSDDNEAGLSNVVRFEVGIIMVVVVVL